MWGCLHLSVATLRNGYLCILIFRSQLEKNEYERTIMRVCVCACALGSSATSRDLNESLWNLGISFQMQFQSTVYGKRAASSRRTSFSPGVGSGSVARSVASPARSSARRNTYTMARALSLARPLPSCLTYSSHALKYSHENENRCRALAKEPWVIIICCLSIPHR